jgi:hypothetical protein
MDRMRVPTEFGFTTPSYVPRERARPTWKTMVFGALISFIPLVGAGIGAVYIDRRQIPSTYDAIAALKTAVIQLVAVALLALVVWIIFGLVLGMSIQLNPQVSGPTV